MSIIVNLEGYILLGWKNVLRHIGNPKQNRVVENDKKYRLLINQKKSDTCVPLWMFTQRNNPYCVYPSNKLVQR